MTFCASNRDARFRLRAQREVIIDYFIVKRQ
jgi:hypothetical protein